MTLPPDFEVPEGFRLGLNPRQRRGKLIGRIWLEVRCLCDRSYRRSELVLFDEYWKNYELDSIATRLALRDLRLEHGKLTALWVAAASGRGLRLLPERSPQLRAQIYQIRAQFEKSRDNYRIKLGLPPRHAPDDAPKPP
jgi:hypothetical protein